MHLRAAAVAPQAEQAARRLAEAAGAAASDADVGQLVGEMYQHIADSAREIANTALRLAAGECGGGYHSASSIVSNALSAISSMLWQERDRTTRKRFVETLTRYAGGDLRTTYASIPLFAAHLEGSTDSAKKKLGREMRVMMLPPLDDQIVTGEDVDVDCDRLVLRYPQLEKRAVRKLSYANLLYEQVRCGLVHTYSLRESTVPFPLTERKAFVSYVNSAIPGTPTKLIHFHFEWMLELLLTVADNVARMTHLPLSEPAQWWTDGAET